MNSAPIVWSAYDNDMDSTSIYLLVFLLAGVASWYVVPRRWLAMLSWLGRRISGFRGRSIDVDGRRWRYVEGGHGPTLVLFHGMAAEADHWLGTAGQLRREFRVLVPELPGYSIAEPPTTDPVSFETLADQVAAWLDALGVDECLLGGNSVGGWAAATFAARFPGRTRGLWLLAPFGVSSAPATAAGRELASGGNPYILEAMGDFRELTGLLFHKPPQVPYPIARASYLNLRRLAPIIARMPAEVLATAETLESLATRLDMPVLVEWGRHDQAMDPAGAEILAGCLPSAEVVLHGECGHMVMLECPTRAASAFRRFARKQGWLES